MMKRLILAAFFLCVLSTKLSAQNLDEVIRFIKDHPEKASIVLNENGKEVLNVQGSNMMPLASAAKTIIAIEFSNQAASKQLDAGKKVSIKALNKYYIPNTDGGAHLRWLKSLMKNTGDSVTLLQIAKGMIKFSSNANTEYLEDLLGLENINKNIKTLGLKQHDPYFYFTAAALMTCLKPTNINETEWVNKLNNLSKQAYHNLCEINHTKLKTDSNFIKTFSFANLPHPVEKIWSDRLVASNTSDYVSIMQKINSRTFFKPTVQNILEQIMEWPMAYPNNQNAFKHLGQKGGSTGFILTDAFYLTDKSDQKIACAFFFNNLTAKERAMIELNFGNFEAGIITDPTFRLKLVNDLK